MSSRNDILRMLATGLTPGRVAAQLQIPLAAVLKVAPQEAPKAKPKKKSPPPPPKAATPPAEPAVPPAPPAPPKKRNGPPKGVSRKDPAYVAECAKKGKTPKVGGNPSPDPEKRKLGAFKKGNPGGKLKKSGKNNESITESFRRYWREHTAQEDKDAVWTGLLMRARIGDDRAIKLMVDLNGESLEAEMKNKLIKDAGCRVIFTLPAKGDA